MQAEVFQLKEAAKKAMSRVRKEGASERAGEGAGERVPTPAPLLPTPAYGHSSQEGTFGHPPRGDRGLSDATHPCTPPGEGRGDYESPDANSNVINGSR
jgi:hypothetical protein